MLETSHETLEDVTGVTEDVRDVTEDVRHFTDDARGRYGSYGRRERSYRIC